MTTVRRWVIPLAIVAAFALAWQLASNRGLLSTLFFPAPTTIAQTVLTMWSDGRLSSALLATLSRLGLGLAAGAIPATILGLAIGRSRPFREAIDPLIAAAHPIPKIAVLPLLMIFMGVGDASRIAAVALSSFFPMYINCVTAVREIPSRYFEVVRAYGGKEKDVFFHVVIPASFPFILAGLRIAANAALGITIAIELVDADDGLGHLLWFSWQTLRIEELFATLIVIALVGLVINGVLQICQKLLAWSAEEATS